jgi:hypothetical protein
MSSGSSGNDYGIAATEQWAPEESFWSQLLAS